MNKSLRTLGVLLVVWVALSAVHGLSGCRGVMTSSLSKSFIKQDSRMDAVSAAFFLEDTLYLEFRDEHGNPMTATVTVNELADDFGQPMPFQFERLRTLVRPEHSTQIPVVEIPDSINYHSDKELLSFLSNYDDVPTVIGVSKNTAGYQLIGLAIPLPRYGNHGEITLRRPWNPGGFYRTSLDWTAFLLLYPFAVIGDLLTFWMIPMFP